MVPWSVPILFILLAVGVTVYSRMLPKRLEAMDAALLPDQRIIDIMKNAQEPKTVIKEVEVIK